MTLSLELGYFLSICYNVLIQPQIKDVKNKDIFKATISSVTLNNFGSLARPVYRQIDVLK